MHTWMGHVLQWQQSASDFTEVREAKEMAHDDASVGLHLSACITTLICKCNELTMTRTTKWMYIYIYMYIISCVMSAYFLSLICEIWMWFEFEFEFICLLYFIWIYMPAVFFLIQEIIYRGGQIIKPATANQHNRGRPQKVSAVVK